MVILYGSYARGDHVDIKFEYQSDFDILAICGSKKTKNFTLQREVEEMIRADESIETRVSLSYYTFREVNREIERFNYLFVDIRREGIVLFNPEKLQLEKVKELPAEQRKPKAIEDFDYWMKSSDKFFVTYEFHFSKGDEFCALAAFNLHQATEHLYMCILLVYTAYKPKSHCLEELNKMARKLNPTLEHVFPLKSEEDKELFTLLKRAYVDSRYDTKYKITKEQLATLAQWIKNFKKVTEKVCKAQIESL